jgi:hypothetical protein
MAAELGIESLQQRAEAVSRWVACKCQVEDVLALVVTSRLVCVAFDEDLDKLRTAKSACD